MWYPRGTLASPTAITYYAREGYARKRECQPIVRPVALSLTKGNDLNGRKRRPRCGGSDPGH